MALRALGWAAVMLLGGCSALFEGGGDSPGSTDGGDVDVGTPADIEQTGCPQEFKLFKERRCYKEIPTQGFATANVKCREFEHMDVPAHLATLPDATALVDAGDFLSSVSEGNAWIGLFDVDDEWRWITGETFDPDLLGAVSNQNSEDGRCVVVLFNEELRRSDCFGADDNAICEWDGLTEAIPAPGDPDF